MEEMEIGFNDNGNGNENKDGIGNEFEIGDENGSEKITGNGKSKGKLRRSCEGCRRFKVRCLASEVDEDVCQRCVKGGRRCVFMEGKRRPKKTRDARLRVEEMEQKIESLMALVTSGVQTTKGSSQEIVPAIISTPLKPPEISISSPLQNLTSPRIQYLPKASKPFQAFNIYPSPIPTMLPFPIFDDIQDVISRGVVTYDKAEKSLRHFRTTALSFPFVIIPPHTSLEYLRRHKPFLLLAILAMAANDNMKVQKVLDQELRDALGRRVFVSGETSLDLLQGTLIYLTWHHFFFEPDHQQIYQLCQSAVSMAIDLEITRPEQHRRHNPSHSFNLLSVIAESNCVTKLSSQDAEAKRAFLGCYYLSSTLCIGLRKPNNMRYTNYTEECCQLLATTQEVESDRLIPYFIQLQKLADDINRTFDYDGHQELTTLDPLRIEMFAERFKKELNQLEKSFPTEVWKHDMLMMAYYHLHTFLNEIGFHKTASSPFDMRSTKSTSIWSTSLTRSSILISCLSTSKDYLTRYLSLPTDVLFTSTFPDYAKLVYNVLVLKLFATWDQDDDLSHIQKNADMAGYMEALVKKFENLGRMGKERGLVEDYSVYLVRLFQTYEGRAREGMGVGSSGFEGSGGLDISVLQVLPLQSGFDAQVAAADLGASAMAQELENEGEEQWDDMINGWPPILDPHDLCGEALFT